MRRNNPDQTGTTKKLSKTRGSSDYYRALVGKRWEKRRQAMLTAAYAGEGVKTEGIGGQK